MVYVAGSCSFQEARSRPDASLFALCHLGTTTFVPFPDQSVKGVSSDIGWHRLKLDLLRLPSKLQHLLIGLALPAGHDFSQEDFRLQLVFGDGSKRIVHQAIDDGAGKRYALLAAVIRRNGSWDAGRLDPFALFESKRALSKKYAVPDKWLQKL